MNVNVLTSDTPFSVFKRFGYQSGRDVDKFIDYLDTYRSSNGLLVLSNYINAYLSLVVEHSYDMGTHMMFICSVSESKLICNKESITYDYYQKNVKPKPVSQKKGWVCKVCGYVYEGEELPSDYICPICKHPYSDFIKI